MTGSGAGCGSALTSHPQVAKVSFTGSTATGKHIARVAADRLTRVTLELGGKNPAIVLKDAQSGVGNRRADDRQFPQSGAGLRRQLTHLY
ncbi:Phenylacetaldehyde dehydrogenase [Raoultella ornithinolytica]|nr:Phenylacetaldehyde dehydrogenase [Raoultella ornithinolytica]